MAWQGLKAWPAQFFPCNPTFYLHVGLVKEARHKKQMVCDSSSMKCPKLTNLETERKSVTSRGGREEGGQGRQSGTRGQRWLHNPVNSLKATGMNKAWKSYLSKYLIVRCQPPASGEASLQGARTHKPQKTQSLFVGAETGQAEARMHFMHEGTSGASSVTEFASTCQVANAPRTGGLLSTFLKNHVA